MSDSGVQLLFVGRSRELKALQRFYDKGGYHHAGFLLLYGRRGVGKTRLLHQFLKEQAIAEYFY